ncbi:MAG: Uma2 family endonuclease [Planctomycetes bacterium]|nr:Uma2 family endonuclease [Planctomycetota bacterium]
MSLRADRKKLSYEDYVLYPNDGKRHEIVDGDHFMNPSPNLDHQTISRRLQFELYQKIELTGLGQVFDAPTDVQLSPHDIVVPDLVVVLKENRILTPSRIKGVPDLIVEILSPSNRDYDTGLKRTTYERAGVPEYWIVDPESREIDPLRLEDGVYSSAGVVSDRIRFTGLPDLEIDLSRVW